MEGKREKHHTLTDPPLSKACVITIGCPYVRVRVCVLHDCKSVSVEERKCVGA